MSLAIVHSRAQDGVSAPPVTVEVHLSGGLPGTSIVGLPEAAVKEARDRVRVAIQNAQLEYPARRVTVSLAPADLPKDGGNPEYVSTRCSRDKLSECRKQPEITGEKEHASDCPVDDDLPQSFAEAVYLSKF